MPKNAQLEISWKICCCNILQALQSLLSDSLLRCHRIAAVKKADANKNKKHRHLCSYSSCRLYCKPWNINTHRQTFASTRRTEAADYCCEMLLRHSQLHMKRHTKYWDVFNSSLAHFECQPSCRYSKATSPKTHSKTKVCCFLMVCEQILVTSWFLELASALVQADPPTENSTCP